MRFFVLIVLTTVVFGCIASPASAQENPINGTAAGNTTVPEPVQTQTATPAPTQTPTPEPETNQTVAYHIDGNTRVLSYDYDSEAGTLSVTIESDRPQAVTISDAGALSESGGGVIPSESEPIDGVRTLTIPVTRTDQGFVGVTIATDNTLYGIVIEPEREGPFERTSPTTGWLGGSTVAMIMIGLAAYRHKNREPDKPERMG